MESFWDYSVDSEVMLKVGITLMKIVIFLTIAVFFQVIFLRSMLVFRASRRARFLNLWRPILMESVSRVPDNLPNFNHRYIHDFIAEWNSLYVKLGGISHENLIEIARRLDIQHAAVKMLISRHAKVQLTGIITLGNMRTAGTWDLLTSIAKSHHTILSMAAYRSLILINSNRALDELLPTLLIRLDWPPSMVARILKDTDSIKVCKLIESTCEKANEKQLFNLIQYLNTLKCMCTHEIIHNILAKKNHSDEIISLCLTDLNDPTSLYLVRKYAKDPNWKIRAQAAVALGNIGTVDDVRLLAKLVSDEAWWVRYRAAQSLSNLPFVKIENLRYAQKKHPKKLAKEILKQVIAEHNLT